MKEIFAGLLIEIWMLFEEMAPYLLFGFLVAGILNLFISRERVTRHLAENRFSSVLKASLFGIPLPLCSCGVIPVAAHLQKQGANRGPILSFLISTPTTGVDSILATYSLMGPLLAIARPVAALFNGLLTGVLANREATAVPKDVAPQDPEIPPAQTLRNKMGRALQYAFGDLITDIAKWLVIGIVAGGVISYLVPTQLVEDYLGNPLLAYPLMLLIGIPMYVCAIGSIPIAAALILKGMSPGAGFIFLFAGPATNTATLSFVGGKMGRKSLLLYVSTILLSSILFGALVDVVWQLSGKDLTLISGQTELLPEWLKTISALLLSVLIVRALWPGFSKNEPVAGGISVIVPNMDCEHCKVTIDTALRELPGVGEIDINLSKRKVIVRGAASRDAVQQAIQKAGYTVLNP